VSNDLKPERGTLTHYLDFNEKDKKALVFAEPNGKRQKAVLNYVVKRRENRNFLVEIELITGRKHQIRAQLSSVGSPILGDKKYGSQQKFREGAIALESCYVSFIHPTKKEMFEVFISEEESSIVGGFT
jgi:23S rRNA pseudouridine1911/1915/1917 synthase